MDSQSRIDDALVLLFYLSTKKINGREIILKLCSLINLLLRFFFLFLVYFRPVYLLVIINLFIC